MIGEQPMSNDSCATLFDLTSHNPSFFSVKEALPLQRELLDFCIPVNLHFPPADLVHSIHERLDEILRYYPDYAGTHQAHIAELTGLDPETIVPCNGSTEIITKLCQQASGPILTSIPTFSRWTDLPVELHVRLFTIQRQREREFRLGVEEIVSRVHEVGARTLVISNPNNPTGAWLTSDEVEALASSLGDLDAVIIDESFIDFSDLRSVGPRVCSFSNLVVVKSLGKSFGWHGVRLGYAVAEPGRAESLRAQLPFWNINGLAAYVLRTVTRFSREYRASFAAVANDRRYMTEQLAAIPELTIYPSKANFLFVELPVGTPGRALRNQLLERHGVIVRECSNKIGSSERYLRLAVQKPTAVDALVQALRIELDRIAL
jgi:histidinol-phosphate/aromatic aminotransferase/cobyric acid decarboxylase-like protein